MQINPDGKVVPCYQISYPAIMGDANHQTMQEIWNGEGYRSFRRAMLDGRDTGERCLCQMQFHPVPVVS